MLLKIPKSELDNIKTLVILVKQKLSKDIAVFQNIRPLVCIIISIEAASV